MGYTPYDWNESLQHRIGYVERRLRQGSPVVGRAYDNGLLLLSVRKNQRKVFEIYDHIMFSGLGSQSDLEAIRIHSINFAHEEGFSRSPDDVSVGRLVNGLSPILKKAFADAFSAPYVFRGVYGEIGRIPERDLFTSLNYDGEYSTHPLFAAIGANESAEEKMRELLAGEGRPSLEEAFRVALNAWAEGQALSQRASLTDRSEDGEEETSAESALEKALSDGSIEAGILERHGKASRFRILTEAEIRSARGKSK